MTPKNVRWRELRYHWEVYLFIVPTLMLIGLFQYYPAATGIFHSFFRWNGADISEWVGLGNYTDLFGSEDFWNSFKVAFILGAWNIFKMIPPLLVAVCIHRCSSERMQFFYRCLFVIPMVLPALVVALVWRSFFFEASAGYLNQFLYSSGLYDALCYFDRAFQWGTWVNGTYQGVFVAGMAPNWLGDPKLLLAACILWGFPWVGSFAVLTHLAKLQNIGKEIYEAAEIDGVSWLTKFTRIEFPLITSSIYLILVFTIIDTLKDAATILCLTDMNGGPGGVVAVPALFMIRIGFRDNKMGYACAISIVLTVIVLALQKLSTLVLNWSDLTVRQRTRVRLIVGAVGAVLLLSGRFVPMAVGMILIVSMKWLLAAGYWLLAKAKAAILGFQQPTANSQQPIRLNWDARMRRKLERRQTPAYRLAETLKSIFLRFSKHLVIWLVLLSALLPMYLMLIVSVKTNQQFYQAPAMLTRPLHFDKWKIAWDTVGPGLANSIYLSISTTLLTLFFALCGAYFFARVRMPCSGFLWNALLVLMMMPSIANLIPLFGLLRELDLMNTLSALILVGTATGQAFAIFVLTNFIADIPQDLFEAAEIDGATHFQQLKTVVVPLSGTILGTLGVILFIQQWNDFVLPLVIIRDHLRYPVIVALQRFIGEYVRELGPLMAGFIIASVPVIVLFIFSMKLFIKGMTEGAVKG